jgi:hypothetical protein
LTVSHRGGTVTLNHALGRGETLHSPLLTGLKIDLDDVLSLSAFRRTD